MKQRGFTLIEMMIGIVIIGILITIGVNFVGAGSAAMSGRSNITWGINGMTESRCIEGYKFIVGQEGQARQILDEFGKGVRCEQQSIPNPRGM